MIINAAAVALAIVVQNQAPLQSAPREGAVQQATLWQGELLEVRGQSLDYLQVYDHRRERAGYIRARDVYPLDLTPQGAPGLLSVIRFFKDAPGAEALGIGLTSAYFKAVPASALTVEPFELLGAFSDRLAARASEKQTSKTAEATIAAQLDVASEYGVRMRSFEHNGTVTICYDGDMFRRVMGNPAASPDAAAQAALGLTRHACVDPELSQSGRFDYDNWRSEVLGRVQLDQVSGELQARVHVRRAGVEAALAFEASRRGEPSALFAARAIEDLAAADKALLSDSEQTEFNEAAVRVGASRWAVAAPATPAHGLGFVTRPGDAGQTCVLLVDDKHGPDAALARRCTYATVWTASGRINPSGTSATLAVQPLEGWRELWVFRREAEGWSVVPVPPSFDEYGIGYLEFAGWVPGGGRMLAARETLINGTLHRRFEVLNLRTLATESQVRNPQLSSLFARWQERDWLEQSVALR